MSDWSFQEGVVLPRFGKTETSVISPRNGSYMSRSIKITCVKSFSKKRCHPLLEGPGRMGDQVVANIELVELRTLSC